MSVCVTFSMANATERFGCPLTLRQFGYSITNALAKLWESFQVPPFRNCKKFSWPPKLFGSPASQFVYENGSPVTQCHPLVSLYPPMNGFFPAGISDLIKSFSAAEPMVAR